MNSHDADHAAHRAELEEAVLAALADGDRERVSQLRLELEVSREVARC